MAPKQIGSIIRFHRKKAKLSQEELEHLAELGKTVVFDIENGKLSIRLDTLLKMLNVLNIQLEFQGPLTTLFKTKMRTAKILVNGITEVIFFPSFFMPS
ncbi:MAG: helix-turn-helix domain-containing protein [Rhabdochlamydiaceae bacterium]|nr:helix-turn-helix domain-containing protein [Rhabdochlamydiaceae bacterium]